MVTIICCGILTFEVRKVLQELGISSHVVSMPPELHLNPSKLERKLCDTLKEVDDSAVFVVYGKCCPRMDDICRMHNARRIQGENCYEIVAGPLYYQLLREEPGTYFLLPQLCAQFEWLTKDLALEKTKKILFKNYTQCVLFDTGAASDKSCQSVAEQLGLSYRKMDVGLKILEKRVRDLLKENDVKKRNKTERGLK